jgi:hypothetical protein
MNIKGVATQENNIIGAIQVKINKLIGHIT